MDAEVCLFCVALRKYDDLDRPLDGNQFSGKTVGAVWGYKLKIGLPVICWISYFFDIHKMSVSITFADGEPNQAHLELIRILRQLDPLDVARDFVARKKLWFFAAV